MNIGIVGCGLIGKKRANAIPSGHKIVGVCDINLDRAKELAALTKCDFITDNYKELVDTTDLDLLIVSTLNNQLAPITLYAVQHGKHIIVEKPGATKSSELIPIMQEADRNKVFVKVGFNHRYHPAMLKAKEILEQEKVGEIMFIRGRYGHGGRKGYDKEWRADVSISGGGETLDQGTHLIDLSRWYFGEEFDDIIGFTETYFWNMSVDDNGFMGLRTKNGRIAWLQVSCTEWKNMFSFEIYCKNAKISIEGLGGSYGIERLYHYQMSQEMGPPDTVIYEYPKGDKSWELEFQDVVQAIELHQPLKMGDIKDAYEALKIVEKIYCDKEKI